MNPAIFDPYEYPDADFCMNCYSGAAQNKTEMEGIWVITPQECIEMGGDCCGTNADGIMNGIIKMALRYRIQRF